MGISLFDTHCDTAYEMYKRKTGLKSNGLHISLEYAKKYDSYCQATAVWSDNRRSDNEAYSDFFNIQAYLKKECQADGTAQMCRTYEDIESAHESGKAAFILTVEDARILACDISRLDALAECGVKILTFQWQGESCIGGGFDTELGLTPFGKETAKRCAELGITADISHACERTARDIIEIMAVYNKPVIATHSNSYKVCHHKRNMSDALCALMVGSGGIVGISLAPQHLSVDSRASSDTVLAHIEHYAERFGIGCVSLGCDFDGIETTPSDIRNLAELENLAEKMLSHNYSEQQVNCVFFENAKRFLKNNL